MNRRIFQQLLGGVAAFLLAASGSLAQAQEEPDDAPANGFGGN